jgi:spermidine/putrescine transport system ATP-binding protein
MTEAPIIAVTGVTKRYAAFAALKGIDLDIRRGEFFSLLGPSGCGKTTLLRLIAGFDEPSDGDIRIDGASMRHVPPNRRPTNMVFQSYAVFPHLNVEQNVAYGLRRLKLDRAEQGRRVAEALEMVGLEGLGRRRANELSGGQRQRVALARALVLRPKVLLLDEPLSALDKKLREQMQGELRRLQRAVGITFILVTHDQYEALAMSDRMAVMFEGLIAQVAAPRTIYERPVSRRVAHFIGGMNFIRATVEGPEGTGLALEAAGIGRIGVPRPEGWSPGGEIVLGIRPERLTVLAEAPPGRPTLSGEIVDATYFGEVTHYDLAIPGQEETVTVAVTNDGGAPLETGARVRLGWAPDALMALV